MNLADRVGIPEQVMARKVGDETVILDLASGMYFGLDAVGTRAWQLMEEGRTLKEVCDAVLDEFDAGREQVERDILALVAELRSRRLIEPR
jgi:hypothetical protein